MLKLSGEYLGHVGREFERNGEKVRVETVKVLDRELLDVIEVQAYGDRAEVLADWAAAHKPGQAVEISVALGKHGLMFRG